MRQRPTPLVPVLRSSTQAELLAIVLGDPGEEWSFTQLAQAVDTSLPTVGREMTRAEQAGLVTIRVLGRSKLVSANIASEYFEPLARLLLIGFGPRRLLTEALAELKGIENAYLFGSWAARYSGNPGAAPKDIDVLLIGTPDRSKVYAAIEQIESRVGRPIEVTFRTPEQWDDRSDPFIATVRSRPLVQLVGDSGGEQ